MLNALDSLLNDPSVYPRIDSIIVTAAASPIAGRKYNDRLSIKRAAALKDYMMREHPCLDPGCIYTYPIGIDWEGFRALVNEDKELPSRREILSLLDQEPDKDLILDKLRTLGGKENYDYLLNKIYPLLQYATFYIRLKNGAYIPSATGSPLKMLIERDTIREIIHDTIYLEKLVPLPVEMPEVAPDLSVKKPFYLALKTNMLYDLALLPNLSLEIPIGKKWSVVLDGKWSWWNTWTPTYYYHRIQVAELDVRYWFGNRTSEPLHGFYLGLYGMGGTYDIRLFTKNIAETGYLSNWSYSAGFTGGYSKALSKRLNLEFGLGLGYFGGTYKTYNRSDYFNHFPHLNTYKSSYVGPTQAGISLVWWISGANKKPDKQEK
jgi:hypothetical protein